MLTHLLAWMLNAGFVFGLISSIARENLDLGCFVLLIAGGKVRDGSQTALRIVILFACIWALAAWVGLVSSLLRWAPLNLGNKWASYDQLEYWTLGVSPLVYVAAAALLSILALRSRQLGFWTKGIKWTAAFVGIVLAALCGKELWQWSLEAKVRREMPAELAAARTYVTTHGGSILVTGTSTGIVDSSDVFKTLPQIQRVSWKPQPRLGGEIYSRHAGGIFPQRKGQTIHYSEFQKDPAGNPGKLELEVVLPEGP